MQTQLLFGACTFSAHYIEKFYRHIEPETGRRYLLADLTNPNRDRPNLTYEFLGINRVWRWTQERMQETYEKGLVVQKRPGAVPRLKRYLDEMKGVPIDTIWDDIKAYTISFQRAGWVPYPEAFKVVGADHQGQQRQGRCCVGPGFAVALRLWLRRIIWKETGWV